MSEGPASSASMSRGLCIPYNLADLYNKDWLCTTKIGFVQQRLALYNQDSWKVTSATLVWLTSINNGKHMLTLSKMLQKPQLFQQAHLIAA